MEWFGQTNRRLGRRKNQAVAQVTMRRLVSFNAGNITITPLPTASPPTVPPIKPSLPSPPPHSKPFAAVFLAIPPPKPNPPPLFSSFADLVKVHPSSSSIPPIPPSQRGILPLPEEGWTRVTYRKKYRRSNLLSVHKFPHPSSKPKRCFLCGDRAHMARSCSLGDFKCFACNRIGHTSACCPHKKNPPLPSIIPPSASPPLCSSLPSPSPFGDREHGSFLVLRLLVIPHSKSS